MKPSEELEKIISPVTLLSFQNDYFEKKPLLIARKDPDYFKDLLSIDMISSYLERKDIRYPALRLVKNGLELPQTEYLKNFPFGNQIFDRVVDNDRLFTSFSNGATIVFQALHRTVPSLSILCQHLEKYFNFPLQTNIYLTPGSSQGFAPHFDNHDVFILQTHGSKKWRVYDSPVFLPTKPFDKSKWTPTKPQIEVELNTGDTLYIPRGFVHEALTTDSVSMHITLGLLAYTWIDVFRLLLGETNDIRDFRKSFDWSALSENEIKSNLTELMNKLRDSISAQNIKKEFAARFSKKGLSADQNRLIDLISMDYISTKTQFKTRSEINFMLEKDTTEAILTFYNKKIQFPLYALDTMKSIVSKDDFFISDLASSLDEKGKLTLCKKLLSEGFLTIYNNA